MRSEFLGFVRAEIGSRGLILLVAAILGLAGVETAHAQFRAFGDFNGDAIADLAIGVPNEGIARTVGSQTITIANAGEVIVIYGSAANGLSITAAVPPQLIHQDIANVEADAEANDRFGSALAAGDFNGDTFADLAVSVPGDNAVQIFNGSSNGLLFTNDRLILGTQFFDNQNLPLTFRAGLAVGDFNGDNIGDLAIEASEPEGIGVRPSIVVLYGSTQSGIQFGGLDVIAFGNSASAGEAPDLATDLTLAVGDFAGDGADDIAVGLPFSDVPMQGGGTALDAGSVTILRGIVGSVTTGGIQITGATGLTETNANFFPDFLEHFGEVLAVGDFDGDGKDDLAVGTPLEDVVGSTGNFQQDAGFVAVFRSAATLHGVYTQLPLVQFPLANEHFGGALTAGDFNGDGVKDLVIGTPGDTINGVPGAGSVVVIYGILSVGLPRPPQGPLLPLITGTVQTFHQDTTDIADNAEVGDHFGASLSAWNFGRSNHDDLAIGVPDEDMLISLGGNLGRINLENRVDVGIVQVLYGSASGLQAAGSQTWSQQSTGIPDSAEAGDQFGGVIY